VVFGWAALAARLRRRVLDVEFVFSYYEQFLTFNVFQKRFVMRKLTLQYIYDSEHFLLPESEVKLEKSPKKGTPIVYIGTAVLRDFRDIADRAKDRNFDVYFIENWNDEESWIRQLSDNDRDRVNYFTPDSNEPLFDCDAIKVFAESGYYFIDERTGGKSLKHFNVRWHNYVKGSNDNWAGTQIISLAYYPCCWHFNSCGKDLTVEYHDGIPVKVTQLN